VKTWWRLHRVAHGACFFSRDVSSRFSSEGLGVLYLADAEVTAFWEVYWDDLAMRPPGERRISTAKLAARAVTRVTLSRDVRVFDTTSPHALKAVSASAGTFLGDYEVCQRWARALEAHPDRPEGILANSTRDAGARCLALFEGAWTCAAIHLSAPKAASDSLAILASLNDNNVEILAD
jgi:hypothetical protein